MLIFNRGENLSEFDFKKIKELFDHFFTVNKQYDFWFKDAELEIYDEGPMYIVFKMTLEFPEEENMNPFITTLNVDFINIYQQRYDYVYHMICKMFKIPADMDTRFRLEDIGS